MAPTRHFEKANDKVKKRHRRKRHNEAARGGKKDGEPAAEARKNGEPHRAEKEVKPYGYGAALAAQEFQSEKHAEHLQRKRDRSRNGDESANGVERHREGDIGNIARVKLFQHVFFHTVIIVFPYRKDKRIAPHSSRLSRGDASNDSLKEHPFLKFTCKRELNA